MKNIILFSFMAIFLSSCSKFSDGSSVWGGGRWILPILTGLGSAWFFYIAWRKSRSGSDQQTQQGIKDFKENVPIYKSGQFIFACALLIATIVIIIMVNSDR